MYRFKTIDRRSLYFFDKADKRIARIFMHINFVPVPSVAVEEINKIKLLLVEIILDGIYKTVKNSVIIIEPCRN